MESRFGVNAPETPCVPILDGEIKLSIIIPAYNSVSTIAQCLNSVFQALPEGIEVIVVDDGSSDETVAIAGWFPTRVIRLGSNEGPNPLVALRI